MKEYRAAWRYYFFTALFTCVTFLGMYVIWMLLSGRVSFSDGEMNKIIAILLSIMIGVVLCTYAITAFNLIKQLVKHKRCVLTVTSAGVENTLVFIAVLAFVIVLPVKLIPWEAVTYYDTDLDKNGSPYIRVKTKYVDAGLLAKFALMIMGYSFCISFVKPCVSYNEVDCYKERFNLNPLFSGK